MRIRQIRNATLVIDYAGSRILVDPWFEDKNTGMLAPSPWPERNQVRSPLVELPMPVSEIVEGVDAIAITHVHPDHFEEKTARMLPHSLPTFVQDEMDAQKVEALGFEDVRVMLDEGATFAGLVITRTCAQHGLTPQTDCGPASGVVLQAQAEPTLYLAGDTIWYEGVAQNLRRFHPEVTVLNCCGATLRRRGRIIMHDEDVLAVCNAAPWTHVVASHMEAVNHANVSRAHLRTFVDTHGVGERVLIPEDGELLEFR